MSDGPMIFNPPPGWPKPPAGWTPPRGWEPDPAWPPPPKGWRLWIPASGDVGHTPPSAGPVAEAVPERPKGPPPPPRRNSTPGNQAAGPPPFPRPTAEGSAGLDRLSRLEAENAELRERLASSLSSDDVVLLDDESVLQSVGIYRYHHPLESAAAYKERLEDLSERIASVVKADGAIVKSNMFTFDNSLAKGRKI